jgi:hypothetical protein
LIRSDNDVHVIRPAVDGVQVPAASGARFGDLPLDNGALFGIQSARVLGHSRFRLQLSARVWELPAMSVFDPTAFITWKPRAVRAPGQEVRERLRHRRLVLASTCH